MAKRTISGFGALFKKVRKFKSDYSSTFRREIKIYSNAR